MITPNTSTATLSLSELIMYNCVKKCATQDSNTTRHIRDRESPLAIYLSLLVHAQTRTRDNVNKVHNLGQCASYDRMMSISTDMTNSVCTRYQDDDLLHVCPPRMKSGIFTVGAVDNIDHNPSARTAQDSFHGTAISLMQFPTKDVPGTARGDVSIDPNPSSGRSLVPLPESYTLVPPAAVQNKCNITDPAVQTDVIAGNEMLPQSWKKETSWLETMAIKIKKDKIEKSDCVSWAAYHASQQPPLNRLLTNIALLPLFHENANYVAMILHSMNMVKKTVNQLNPGQVPVLTMDQPLYAIAKQIQWNWPETHGEAHIVIMFGGLHIEMNLLKLSLTFDHCYNS